LVRKVVAPRNQFATSIRPRSRWNWPAKSAVRLIAESKQLIGLPVDARASIERIDSDAIDQKFNSDERRRKGDSDGH
jgi:hypothetical protein